PPPHSFSTRGSLALCDLPSFPTRRSSDLVLGVQLLGLLLQAAVQGDRAGHRLAEERDGLVALQEEAEGPPGQLEATRPSRSSARDRKSTRLNSSHVKISYAVFCLKKKKKK